MIKFTKILFVLLLAILAFVTEAESSCEECEEIKCPRAWTQLSIYLVFSIYLTNKTFITLR